MAKEVIGPIIIEGGPREVYAAGVGVVAGYDCDIGNCGGVSHRERKENYSEDE